MQTVLQKQSCYERTVTVAVHCNDRLFWPHVYHHLSESLKKKVKLKSLMLREKHCFHCLAHHGKSHIESYPQFCHVPFAQLSSQRADS